MNNEEIEKLREQLDFPKLHKHLTEIRSELENMFEILNGVRDEVDEAESWLSDAEGVFNEEAVEGSKN